MFYIYTFLGYSEFQQSNVKLTFDSETQLDHTYSFTKLLDWVSQHSGDFFFLLFLILSFWWFLKNNLYSWTELTYNFSFSQYASHVLALGLYWPQNMLECIPSSSPLWVSFCKPTVISFFKYWIEFTGDTTWDQSLLCRKF